MVYLLFADQPEGHCPYLEYDGCSVHETRPEACRTFPDFPAEYCLVWPEVHSPE